jgi:tetratricopeptide (TPR) repeat protein
MSRRNTFLGVFLTAAAIAVFALAAPAEAAPGQNSNSGYSGGGNNGFGNSTFGGGYNASSFGGGYNAGHASGGFSSAGDAFGGGTGAFSGRSGTSSGGRSPFSGNNGSRSQFNGSNGSFTRSMPFSGGSARSFPSNSGTSASAILPSQPGRSQGPLTPHSGGFQGNSSGQQAADQWKSGQHWDGHWHWNSGNSYFPSYFVFVPFYYGSFGYYNPYYFGYSDPSAFYALYGNGDSGLPAFNVIGADPNPGPVIAAGANPNAAAGNVAANNPAAGNAAANNAAAGNLAAADVANPNGDAGPDAGADNSAGAEFFGQAEDAFQAGHYRDALRLANHAAVESPRNPKAHELMSLSMFASADYRGAAIEAHVAIALGPIADWAALFGYYGDQQRYTTQLRALEKYSRENPKAADARFLRAYHYLMTGHTDAAKEQLTEAVKLTPNDKLAAELLKKTNANPPALPVPPAAAPAAPQKPIAPQDPFAPKAQPPGFDS